MSRIDGDRDGGREGTGDGGRGGGRRGGDREAADGARDVAPSASSGSLTSPQTGPEGSSATIHAHSFLTLHYRVSLARDGVDVVTTFGGRPATLQLGAGQFSPALEECLIGLEVGSSGVYELAPGVAFGPRSAELVQRIPRNLLEAESGRSDYSPGDAVEFNAPGGGRYAGVFRSLDNDDAIFDFNHPLAGQPVRFEIEILGIL